MDELTTLHNAIEATFRAGLPSVVSVEAFPELNAEVGLPAVLFALTEIGEAPDNGSGKTSLSGRFQVCIMVDSTISKAALQGGHSGSRDQQDFARAVLGAGLCRRGAGGACISGRFDAGAGAICGVDC